MQEEDGARFGARGAGRARELDAAGDERAQRLELDLDALQQPGVDVEPAHVPERRALAHQRRVAREDHHVHVGRKRVRREVDLLHHAHLDAAVIDRRVLAHLRMLAAHDDAQPAFDARGRRLEAGELALQRAAGLARDDVDLRPGEDGGQW